jgi:hypothetical protein
MSILIEKLLGNPYALRWGSSLEVAVICICRLMIKLMRIIMTTRTICSRIEIINQYLENMLQEENNSDIINIHIENIRQEISAIQISANKMENRLRKYRKNIEKLGFKRI